MYEMVAANEYASDKITEKPISPKISMVNWICENYGVKNVWTLFFSFR